MTTENWVSRIRTAAIKSHNFEVEDSSLYERTDLTIRAAAPLVPPDKNPDEVYQLDRRPDLIKLWHDFREIHKRHANDAKWLEVFKAKVAAAAGDRTELYIGDDLVASYKRDGQFPVKRFCEENPHIAAEYTRIVAEEKFDLEAFKQDHPALYEANRARSMRLK